MSDSKIPVGGGPRVTALGGGTGLSTMLRGLKYYTNNLTAIVTVADAVSYTHLDVYKRQAQEWVNFWRSQKEGEPSPGVRPYSRA